MVIYLSCVSVFVGVRVWFMLAYSGTYILTTPPALAHFDPSAPAEVGTDGSGYRIGVLNRVSTGTRGLLRTPLAHFPTLNAIMQSQSASASHFYGWWANSSHTYAADPFRVTTDHQASLFMYLILGAILYHQNMLDERQEGQLVILSYLRANVVANVAAVPTAGHLDLSRDYDRLR